MKKHGALLLLTLSLFLITACNKKAASSGMETTNERALVTVTNPEQYSKKWCNLSGRWEYYENAFLNASMFYFNYQIPEDKIIPVATEIVSIPHYWDNPKGCATYHLRVSGLKPNTRYASFMYDKFSTAGEIYCNGKYVYSCGFCSNDWTKTICGRNMNIPVFTSDQDGTLDIVMRCSNKVYRTGGVYYSFKIAEEPYVQNWLIKMFTLRIMFIGALLIIVIYQMALFFLNKFKRTFLFLSCFAVSAMMRLLFASFSVVSMLFPEIPYDVSLRIEFMPLIWCAVFFVLYMNEYDRLEFKRPVPVIMVAIGVIMTLLNICMPISIDNYLVPVYQIYMVLGGVYGMYLVFAKHGDGQRYVNLFDFLGLTALFICLIHDVLVLYGVSLPLPDSEWVMYGFIIFVLLQSINTGWQQNMLSERVKKISEEMEIANSALYRFVPQGFLEMLGKKDICAVQPKDHVKQKVALINTDIRSFTTLSEGLDGKAVFNMLNIYYNYVSPIIRYYGGFIEKVMGDGVVAVFAGGADNALLAALEMQEAMVTLQDLLIEQKLPNVEIGIGVHYGEVVLGTVGNKKRMSEVIVSPAVAEVMAIEAYHRVCFASVIASEEAVNNIKEKTIFDAAPIEVKRSAPCIGYDGKLYSIEKSVYIPSL